MEEAGGGSSKTSIHDKLKNGNFGGDTRGGYKAGKTPMQPNRAARRANNQ